MPHVRPIHVTALALLAATFTIEAAQAHMPGVRTPSVSVPTNIPRTPGFTVPRDVNSGKSSNSQAGGKSQAGSKPSNASTPTASSPWSAPWDYAQSLHAADIAAKQKTVDDLYAQLQAAGAAMRNASDPANKTLRALGAVVFRLVERTTEARGSESEERPRHISFHVRIIRQQR